MNRNMLNYVLRSNKYFPGGIKEACIIAKEYIKNKGNSCVSEEEFEEAVKTLIAYSFRNADEIPEFWHCDEDCRKCTWIFCPGECNVDKEALRKCPYFEDEGLI